MGKASIRGIWDGYLRTLKKDPFDRNSHFRKHDLMVQVFFPIAVGTLFAVFWPLDGDDLENLCGNIVTGVSIVSSLMCGVAVMLFQLRIQLVASSDIDASGDEVELVDETFSDVLWAVVVGFAAVLLLVLSNVAATSMIVIRRVLVSASIGMVTNLVIVTCMGLKRMNASYEIASKCWGKGAS